VQLIGGIVAAVVVVGVVAAAVWRTRSHDEAHSVEHYHRQLHTLEEIVAHPVVGNGEGPEPEVSTDAPPRPAAVGSSTVRLTDRDRPPPPPPPPPPLSKPGERVTFDDAAQVALPVPSRRTEDRAMHSIDHRPRRIAAPAAAIAAVTVLIVVLVVAGAHSPPAPTHHVGTAASTPTTTATTARTHAHTPAHHHHSSTATTTTTLATVSSPSATSVHSADYTVASSNYSLAVAATSGNCWVDVTNAATGSVLFTSTLLPGQSHTISATGPVNVVAGAPFEFSATVDGSAVSLPFGFQAPFTLRFVPSTQG
jgi:hypothetical protein